MEQEILRKLDDLSNSMLEMREEMRVGFAKLPYLYVPRSEINALRQEAQNARRWAIGLGIPSVIGIAGLALNLFV